LSRLPETGADHQPEPGKKPAALGWADGPAFR
jgi:hypothetical protein